MDLEHQMMFPPTIETLPSLLSTADWWRKDDRKHPLAFLLFFSWRALSAYIISSFYQTCSNTSRFSSGHQAATTPSKSLGNNSFCSDSCNVVEGCHFIVKLFLHAPRVYRFHLISPRFGPAPSPSPPPSFSPPTVGGKRNF